MQQPGPVRQQEGPARLRLPKDAKAPLLARAFVRQAMCEGHSRERRDEVELLVSELVTNAVLHGGSLVTMELECESPEGIHVTVSDSSPAWPTRRQAGPMEEGGRGIELVEMISDAWGVRDAGIPADGAADGEAADRPKDPIFALLPRQAQGKAVWFRLAG